MLVEEGTTTGDDLVAADLVVVVPGGELTLLRDHVRAVEGVVQRAPASVHGVGGEPRVQQRDDQLRAGDAGNLVVDVVGAYLEVGWLVEQVADLCEEGGVALGDRHAGVLAVELVDPGLQLLAPGEQPAVARRKVVDDRVGPVPERLRVDARGRQGLLLDEAVQARGDREPPDLNTLCHATPLLKPCRSFRIVEVFVSDLEN